MKVLFSSLLLVASLAFTVAELSNLEYRTLKDECDRRLLRRGGNLPKLIRLAFHDCVGADGCNGCIDLNNPENFGLEAITAAVTDLYNDNRTMVDNSKYSLADLVALCGVEAVERAYRSTYNGVKEFSFKTGRVTKASCAGDNDGKFPSSLKGYTDTTNWLKNEFGLKDDREAIVLLGAHTMGRTRLNNSGHMGPWTRNENRFDNEYYKVLLTDNQTDVWRQVTHSPEKPQWDNRRPPNNNTQPPPPRMKRDLEQSLAEAEAGRTKRQAPPPPGGGQQPPPPGDGQPPTNGPLIMLNADICLVKSINVNEVGVSQTCEMDVSSCPDSPGRPTVESLANDNTAFVDEFIVAFTKMIENVPAGVTLTPVGGVQANNNDDDDDDSAAATTYLSLVLLLSALCSLAVL